jgi:hypothetical protein
MDLLVPGAGMSLAHFTVDEKYTIIDGHACDAMPNLTSTSFYCSSCASTYVHCSV